MTSQELMKHRAVKSGKSTDFSRGFPTSSSASGRKEATGNIEGTKCRCCDGREPAWDRRNPAG